MITRLHTHLSAWQHATERGVAPHVEEQWAEVALLELRLLGVTGARIGAVLAEVDSHCAESGLTAADAFGDPVAYVRSLDLPSDEGPHTDARAVAATATWSAVQVLGMLATLWGIDALLDRTPLALTAGQIVGVGAVLTAIGLATWQIDSVLRAVSRRPIGLLVVVLAVGSTLFVVLPMLLLDAVVLTAHAGWAAGIGAALLVVGSIGVNASLTGVAADPVRPPLDRGDRPTGTERVLETFTRLIPLMVPAATVLLALFSWLVAR